MERPSTFFDTRHRKEDSEADVTIVAGKLEGNQERQKEKLTADNRDGCFRLCHSNWLLERVSGRE